MSNINDVESNDSIYGSQRQQIKYLDGLCGSGKTHAVCKTISESLPYKSNHLYLAPSKRLVNQTRQMLVSQFKYPADRVIVIHQDSLPDPTQNVASNIVQAMMTYTGGYVILATQQGFERLNDHPYKERWNVWIDEIPSVDSYYQLQLPRNYKMLNK